MRLLRRPAHPNPLPGVEDAIRADSYLSADERRAMVAFYRALTDARKEVALNWQRRHRVKAAGVALPFSTPLPSFLLWAAMVATAALMAVLVGLFGKAAVEWTGDNDVMPRCRRLWVAVAAKAVRRLRRHRPEAVPDDVV